MTSLSFGMMCAEWGAAIQTGLIVVVSIALAAVVALLVLEIVGRVKKPDFVEVRDRAPAEEKSSETEQPADAADEKEGRQEQQETHDETEPVETDEEVAATSAVELDDGAELIDNDDGSDGGTVIVGESYVKVRYNRSFAAKLIQSDDMFKGRYNAIVNELLRYGFKRRTSWGNESWYRGRDTYAKFAIRGKTLNVYLALDPKDHEGNKRYSIKDVGGVSKYKDVPMQYKCKSDRAVARIKELIAAMAQKHGFERKDGAEINFRPDYKKTAELVRDGLIKLYYVTDPNATTTQKAEAAAADIKIKDKSPRDFTTKLMRADKTLKTHYSIIKNELLRYGLKPRVSKAGESWYLGRTTYAKIAIRGKTLNMYLALDPKDFEGTKYNFKDVGEVSKYEAVPLRVKLKSDRSVRWTKELLAAMADKNGLSRGDAAERDFRYVDTKNR